MMQYIDFVEERHRVWQRRQAGWKPPWTKDPILASSKFTNVYRVLDHGSQYLLRNLLLTAETPADALLRSFLYRFTNRAEPWDYFEDLMGRYPVRADLPSVLPEVWRTAKDRGVPLFGVAYRVFPDRHYEGSQLDWLLQLALERLDPILDEITGSNTMAYKLDWLQTISRCGPFMAMQIVTDYGYSPWGRGDENEGVVPGIGCIAGAKVIAPEVEARKVIEHFWDHFQISTRVRLELPDGRLRAPSLMDVQNTLCEYSKYANRSSGAAARPYRPAHPGPQPDPVLPAHW